jgi:hypothetical protein
VATGDRKCGGTIIHKDIILTAAHCAAAFFDGAFVGGNDISGKEAKEFLKVDWEFPHPDFVIRDGVTMNDVMLVKLEGKNNVG